MQPLADPTLSGPRRLLLVDDNPGDARLISEMLKDQWGTGTFDLSVATSFAPALQILQREPPDVLLLDLSLPDSWGLDTLRRVQTVASGVASIVLAGQEDHALALEAVKEGAQDFLVKNDLTGWLLVKTVQYAFERKRIENRLRISEARSRSLAALSHLNTETRVHVERFTAALELSADAIFFVDHETQRVLDVNAAACKVLGYERQDFWDCR
jgi:DNA-binding NtrC family response regulator